MKGVFTFVITSIFLFANSAFSLKLKDAGMLRFPDIHGDKIVFSFAGDLFLVNKKGGDAVRLTTHPVLELFPRFSPDGKFIAFTGQYDGNFNVYVVSSDGGIPKQLTFYPDTFHVSERMGFNNMVIEWTPDGKKILFLSRRNTFNSWFGTLFLVDKDGGLPVQFPVVKGGLTTFSPDGKKFVFNRIFRNFRTWKKYKGGLAQDLWLFDLEKKMSKRLTTYKGTDTNPMWIGNKIYFVSDRGKNLRKNLYEYDLKTGKITQKTFFKDYDITWTGWDDKTIVLENGGYLYVFDVKTGEYSKIIVNIKSDVNFVGKKWIKGARYITSYNISPNAKRGVFISRGDIVTLPAKHGDIRVLTQTSGAKEKYATWSPDGKWIAYISDETGEDELYIIEPKIDGKKIQLTTGGNCFKFAPEWSFDSTKIAFADRHLNLFVVNIKTKKILKIDQGRYGEIKHYKFSPDGNYLTYTKYDENNFRSIFIYSFKEGLKYRITEKLTDDFSPVFSSDGNYLFFLSKRILNPVFDTFDFNVTYQKTVKLFAIPLRNDVPSPIEPLVDEEEHSIKNKNNTFSQKGSSKKSTNVKIDFNDIAQRAVALPVKNGNYKSLKIGGNLLFFISYPIEGMAGFLPGEKRKLYVYDIKERKVSVLMEGLDGFEVSKNGKEILYKKDNVYGIAKVKPGAKKGTYSKIKSGEGKLNTGGILLKVDIEKEWAEMLREAYRYERDYFYSPYMHGLKWKEVYEKYKKLLPLCSTRYDLTYVIGEMIGELGSSHTYTGGGYYPEIPKVNIGLLGVDFELDKEANLYRIKKIYKGENKDSKTYSPLYQSKLDVKEGDYLLEVDGVKLTGNMNPYSLFINKANKVVFLRVNSSPSFKGSKLVKVKTISSEFKLRYDDWVQNNRKLVEKLSNGQIGYIYLPDMYLEGMNAFVKQYYPQIKKKGLIFDVRYNGGGFIDGIIFDRIRRLLAGMFASRSFGDFTHPDLTFYGYMVCLSNEYSASDGDIFTYLFKYYKLGEVIGTRTWGGVIGIRGYLPLLDGGYVTAPEFAFFSVDGKWIVENEGVEPDIYQDMLPEDWMNGNDPQLKRGVEVLLEKIKKHPKKLPQRPPYKSQVPAK